MRTARTLTAVAGAATLLVILSGCVPVWMVDRDDSPARDDRPEASSDARPNDGSGDQAFACADGEDIEVGGDAIDIDITGSCGSVTVRGNSLDVEIASAESVLVEGQQIDLDLQSDAASLVVRGNANEIDAESLDTAEITGDSNDLDAGRIGSLVLVGTKNVVESDGAPGSVSDTGIDNRVETR